MIEHIKKDIFAVKCDAIVHQANCFHTMGSGIARAIREKFPEAYEADKNTKYGDIKKLGQFSFAKVKDAASPARFIVNLYSQFNYSAEERCTRYDALCDGLFNLREQMRAKAKGALRTLAIPFRMGSNRGGGDWNVVLAVITSVFGEATDFKVLICENPALTEQLQNKVSK